MQDKILGKYFARQDNRCWNKKFLNTYFSFCYIFTSGSLYLKKIFVWFLTVYIHSSPEFFELIYSLSALHGLWDLSALTRY